MKNPIALFSTIAAAAIVALGTTVYVNRTPDSPTPVIASEAPAKKPDVAAKVEVPAAPVAVVTPAPAPSPVQQQAAVEPAPVVKTPVAPAAKSTELALQPAPAAAVVPAPVVAPLVTPSLPSFDTVRVEATGDALIAGRAEPEADVTVKWNGKIVGTTKSNADGSFVVIPAKALATGIGAMTIEMSKNGRITTSEGSVFVVVKKDAPATVAKVDPVAPTQVVQSGEVSGVPKDLQLTAVDYDQAGNIVFSGQAAAGSTVRFYVDNAATGEGKADDNGKWSFAGTSAVTPGTHILRADALDGAGKVSSRIELPFLRESVATVAAAQVAVAEPVAPAPVARSIVVEQPAVPAQAEAKVTAQVEKPVETQVAAIPTAPVVAPIEEGPKRLVIQPGNNLWKLSREVYGKGRMFTIIYEANRDQLKNPNKIYPGQILSAPKQN
jgi:Bacterial Ig-like domain/LysM domain